MWNVRGLTSCGSIFSPRSPTILDIKSFARPPPPLPPAPEQHHRRSIDRLVWRRQHLQREPPCVLPLPGFSQSRAGRPRASELTAPRLPRSLVAPFPLFAIMQAYELQRSLSSSSHRSWEPCKARSLGPSVGSGGKSRRDDAGKGGTQLTSVYLFPPFAFCTLSDRLRLLSFPVVSRRVKRLGVPEGVYQFVKFFGSGVIIATR